MKQDIINKIVKSLKHLTRRVPQLNVDSDAGKLMVANAVYEEVFDSLINISTHNDDQLELFTNFEDDLHK